MFGSAFLVLNLQKEWSYMNHGKFGAALKESLEAEMVSSCLVIVCSIITLMNQKSLVAALLPRGVEIATNNVCM